MQDNPRRGILLMVATTIIFAIQDGISRYLAWSYDIITIVAIRYWFLPYLFVRSGLINQVDSHKLPPLANHGCKLAAGCFWPRKYAQRFLALTKLGWFNFMLFSPATLCW